MTSWTNRAVIQAAANGTTSHTVNPASTGTVVSGANFAPTAGRLLICFCEGAVTSTTPSGWTLPTNGSAVNNTGLYVWWKIAAGGDTVVTTHNGTNYQAGFTFYEFPSGSSFGIAASVISAAYSSNGPTLSGLTGTPTVMSALGVGLSAGSNSVFTTAWTAPVIEDVDISVTAVGSATDTYSCSLGFQDSYASASWTPASVSTQTGSGGTPNLERLSWSVVVAAAGPPPGPYAMLRPAVVAP